jgi:hypothetical protein
MKPERSFTGNNGGRKLENGQPYIVITEKDWEKQTPEQRDWLIYNTLFSMNRRILKMDDCYVQMNQRLGALENKPKSLIDKGLSFIGGVIGGILGAVGMKYGGS